MDQKTVNILNKWLRQAGYPIESAELERQYLSHPDIGSVISITDTLNDFNIPNQAVQINAETLFELAEPFIAFIQNNQTEQIVLINTTINGVVEIFNGRDKPFVLPFGEFETIFSGIIVAIEKSTAKHKLINKVNGSMVSAFVGFIAILYLFFFNQQFTFGNVFYFVTALAGLAFSIMLFANANGANSHLINRFCLLTKNTDCNHVLQSRAAKIGKYLSLTDVGIIYFSFQCLYLLLANHELSLLYAISIAAAFFSFYSVYQQAAVIKRWCPLCLSVVGMLLIQGALAVTSFSNISIQANHVLLSLCILVLHTLALLNIKPLIARSVQLKENEIELLSFKRNYHLFLPFYISAPIINDRQLINTQQIIIGRHKAPVQITLITNPLCQACQKAHTVLNTLMQQYPKDLALRLVFYVPFQDQHDPRTMIAGWLANAYFANKEKGIEAIEDWYASPDVGKFDKLRIPIKVIQGQQVFLQHHSEWCIERRLTLTPILLLNNKLFPLIYRTEDLQFHIESVIDFERKIYDGACDSVQQTKVLASNT